MSCQKPGCHQCEACEAADNEDAAHMLAQLSEARARAEKLQAFKSYVHQRLDAAGIPADPNPEATAAHGCRIEGRIDSLLAQRDDFRAERDALKQQVERERGASDIWEGRAEFLDAENAALRSALERAREALLGLLSIGAPAKYAELTIHHPERRKAAEDEILRLVNAALQPPPQSPAPHTHQWTIPADPPIGARCECGATYFDVPGFTGPNLRPAPNPDREAESRPSPGPAPEAK